MPRKHPHHKREEDATSASPDKPRHRHHHHKHRHHKEEEPELPTVPVSSPRAPVEPSPRDGGTGEAAQPAVPSVPAIPTVPPALQYAKAPTVAPALEPEPEPEMVPEVTEVTPALPELPALPSPPPTPASSAAGHDGAVGSGAASPRGTPEGSRRKRASSFLKSPLSSLHGLLSQDHGKDSSPGEAAPYVAAEEDEGALRDSYAQELQGLTLHALRAKAHAFDIADEMQADALASDNPRAALTELLLSRWIHLKPQHRESQEDRNLREELDLVRFGDLKQRCREVCEDVEAVADALDSDNPKAALIDLIVGRMSTSPTHVVFESQSLGLDLIDAESYAKLRKSNQKYATSEYHAILLNPPPEGSPAAHARRVLPGDMIIAVAGVSVQYESCVQVTKRIARAPRPLQITFHKLPKHSGLEEQDSRLFGDHHCAMSFALLLMAWLVLTLTFPQLQDCEPILVDGVESLAMPACNFKMDCLDALRGDVSMSSPAALACQQLQDLDQCVPRAQLGNGICQQELNCSATDFDGWDCNGRCDRPAQSEAGRLDQPDYYRNGYCSPTCPCAAGEGDCDRDTDCQPGTKCSADNSACRLGHLPGWEEFECCEVDNSTVLATRNTTIGMVDTGTGISGVLNILATKTWDTARRCVTQRAAADNGLIVDDLHTGLFFGLWVLMGVACMIVTYIDKRRMHKTAINEDDVSFAPKPLVDGHEMRFIDMVAEAAKPLHYRWADQVKIMLGTMQPLPDESANDTVAMIDLDNDEDEEDEAQKTISKLFEQTGDNSIHEDNTNVGFCSLDCVIDTGLMYVAFQDGMLDLWFIWSHLLRQDGSGLATGTCGVLILVGSTMIQLLQINHSALNGEEDRLAEKRVDALRVAQRVEDARSKFLKLLQKPSHKEEEQLVVAVPSGLGEHAAEHAGHTSGVDVSVHSSRQMTAGEPDHVVLRGSRSNLKVATKAVMATCQAEQAKAGRFRAIQHTARSIGVMDLIVTPLQVRVPREILTAWVRLRRLARQHSSRLRNIDVNVASGVSSGNLVLVTGPPEDLNQIQAGDYIGGPNVPLHARVVDVGGTPGNGIRPIKINEQITQTIVPNTLSLELGEIVVVEDQTDTPENQLLVDKVHKQALRVAESNEQLDRHQVVSRELRRTMWWRGYVDGRPDESRYFPSACVAPFETGLDGRHKMMVCIGFDSTGPTKLKFWRTTGPLVVDTAVFEREHVEVLRATLLHGTVEALLQAVLQWHAVWSTSVEDDCAFVITSFSHLTFYDVAFFSSLSSTVLAAFSVTKPFFTSLSVPSCVALVVSVEAQVLARMIVFSTLTSYFRLGLFSWWGGLMMMSLFLISFGTTTWLIEHGRVHGDYYGGATTLTDRINILKRAVKSHRFTRLELQCVVSPLFGVAADNFPPRTRLLIVSMLNMFQATDCDLRNPPFSHGTVKVLIARILESVAVMLLLVIFATERRVAADTRSPTQDLYIVDQNARMVRNVAAAIFLNILAFVLLAAGATYDRLERSKNHAREKGHRRRKKAIGWVRHLILPVTIIPAVLAILPCFFLLWFGNGARAGLSSLFYVELCVLTYVACFEVFVMSIIDLSTGYGIISHKKRLHLLILLPIVALTVAATIFGHALFLEEEDGSAGDPFQRIYDILSVEVQQTNFFNESAWMLIGA